MEDTHFVEQDNRNAATFALADLGTKLLEECLDILPLDICTCWVPKDYFERALVLPLHACHSTTIGYQQRSIAPFDHR